ncbi:MAG TPA: MerR family transcriptional regulator [Thermomicrobiales bacterium]|nr:MerR family transcriptional regulator [Thermomicrobiales bacterium]
MDEAPGIETTTPTETEPLMQIGEIAERTGLTPRTLRYWEEIGLLPPAERLEGGFRLYSTADLERLTRIVQLKKLLGFSLSEIRRVVEAEEALRALRARNCAVTDPAEQRAIYERAIAILAEQITALDTHLSQVQAMRENYAARVARLRERVAELTAEVAARPADR